MLNDDQRKVVLTILEDDSDENSTQLVKILRSAANANRDLVFGYVGIKQWDGFVETFDVSKSSQLPKLLVWDRDEEYELVSKASSVVNYIFSNTSIHIKTTALLACFLLVMARFFYQWRYCFYRFLFVYPHNSLKKLIVD